MNNEETKNEIMELDNDTEAEVYDLEPEEESGNGILGKILIGAGVLAAGGLAALVYKNRDKLEERRIKKLEKKGYTVIRPEQFVEEDFDDDFEEVSDETEEEKK